MNREILFRGQTQRRGEKVNMNGDKLPGKWVYGGIFSGTGDFSIIYGGETEKQLEKFVVYLDTVGQYTGLTDKNGVRIFEGDLLRGKGKRLFRVDYNTDISAFVASALDGGMSAPCLNVGTMQRYRVVGNVYDNPEQEEQDNESD